MSDDGADLTNGEIARTLKRLDDGQKELVRQQSSGHKAVMEELTGMRGEFIHRTEWDMQNRIHADALAAVKVDVTEDRSAIKTLTDESANLRSHLDRYKGWTAAAGVFLGGALGLLFALIQAGTFK